MININKEWTYRNIHEYHILINICNNNILSISPVLGDLFNNIIDKEISFNEALEKWKKDNSISKEEELEPRLRYFFSKEVLLNE